MDHQGIFVKKNCLRLIEGYAMLPFVFGILFRIPLKTK